MKKKILFGLGTLALVAALCLNVNLAKTNHAGSVVLRDLFSVAQAEEETDRELCSVWCYFRPYDVCVLYVGRPGEVYPLSCFDRYWP